MLRRAKTAFSVPLSLGGAMHIVLRVSTPWGGRSLYRTKRAFMYRAGGVLRRVGGVEHRVGGLL